MARYIYSKYSVITTYTQQPLVETRHLTLEEKPTWSFLKMPLDTPTRYYVYSPDFSSSTGFSPRFTGNYSDKKVGSDPPVYNSYVSPSLTAHIQPGDYTKNGVKYKECSYKLANESYSRDTFIGTVIAESGSFPTNGRHTDGYWYVRGSLVNAVPTITDNTEINKIFYEGDEITLSGSTNDTDKGNIVSVKYKINTGTVRAIATGISDGKKPLNYSKVLKYTMGTLKDGDSVIADGLIDGQTYKITIWAEDDQGGKSKEVVRNFTVVPNRAPVLTINPIENQTNKINSDKIAVSGTVIDADRNDVTVDVKINNNANVRVYSGTPSDFSYDIKIVDLVEGENTITVTSKDTFDFTDTKTIKLNKTRNAVPLKTATARYKINPPAGSASEILAWIQKESGDLTIDADVSMVLSGESEQYDVMNKIVSPINNLLEEKEFSYKSIEAKDNITLKLKLNKFNIDSTQGIKQISGVLD